MFERICIATFSVYQNNKRTAINGMVEPLLSFFLPQTTELDLVDGPHPGSSTTVTKFEKHQDGIFSSGESFVAKMMSPLLTPQNQNGTQVFFKLRDFLSVFELIVRRRKKYDVFIGLESVFTLAGIILKKLGMITTVIYYVSDYSPKRYPVKRLNDIYLWLDRFCCYNADYIWDVSPAIMPARIESGIDKPRVKPCILVPNALFPNQITHLPSNKLIKNSVVFAGTFGFENGTKLAIDAFSYVAKDNSEATLHFFGGSKQLEEELRKIVLSLHLEKNVFFHGFVADAVQLSKKINKYMIGIAPYVAMPGSARWYADATKIRLYLGAGLPIVTTHVPPLGKEIREKGAGIVVQDKPKELANAITSLLADKEQYNRMRKAALAYALNNTWEETYAHALSFMYKKGK
ncbi:MAG: glycosyltransferase [Candidatus Levybacteria bacterium]|nr:glycosyltransferase [Candidatus Levybacteria bacterium]